MLQEIVVSNKSLDLPTQQELLAQHRCDETIEILYQQFSDKLSNIHAEINAEDFEKASKSLKAELDEVKKTYYAQLHRFSVDVVSKKYSDLKRRLYPSLEGLFNLYCQKIQIKAEKIFDLDLKSNDRTISSSTLSSAKSRSLVFYRASLEGKHLLFAFFNSCFRIHRS